VPRLLIADGHLGIWAALAEVFPEVAEQRCWNHYADLRIMPIGGEKAAQAVGHAA
jgi:transposase-like protein